VVKTTATTFPLPSPDDVGVYSGPVQHLSHRLTTPIAMACLNGTLHYVVFKLNSGKEE